MISVVQVQCVRCRTVCEIDVPASGYIDWKLGTLIQDAMPGLSADEREMLISGMCPDCFEDLFGSEE